MEYKLYDIVNTIKEKATAIPNVNSVYFGDVYKLNELPDVDYSSIIITQNQHTANQYFITYSFNLFYIDRLLNNQDNKLEIQSIGIEILNKILKELEDIIDGNSIKQFQVFTERFTSECAGVYTTFTVQVPIPNC